MRLIKTAYSVLLKVNRLFALLAAFALALAACSITYGVLARNLFGKSTTWELEAGIYLILYATFFGAAYTHVAGGQIGINALRDLLSARWQRFHKIAGDSATLAFFALIFHSGWHDMWTAFDRGWHSDTIWGPPLWIPFLSIPVGAALLVVTMALEIILTISDHEPPQIIKSNRAAH
ncbi:MAG: TRAP transporter small permease [Woeseia sp.]